MKRIIVIGVGVVAILLIAYYIYTIIAAEERQTINIVLLNSDKNNSNENYINKIIESVNFELKEIDFKIISLNTVEDYKILEPIGLVSSKDFPILVKDTLNEILNIHWKKINDNVGVNNILESSLNELMNNDHENTCTIFLGSFPNCYDKESANAAVTLIENLINKKILKGKIILSLKTNSEEPEQDIIKYFESTKLNITNSNQVVPKRICDYKKITTVFLSSIPEKKLSQFSSLFKKTLGNNFDLTVFSGDSYNGSKETCDDKKKNEYIELLKKVKSAGWTSIKQIFDNACQDIKNNPSKDTKNLVIIGLMPNAGKGDQKVNWNAIKQAKVYWFLPSEDKLNETTSVFIDGFTINKINFEIIKY
jgi:hypothetical protein